MNPDEENFNNNLFVTNQPIIKKIHPLTTTNKQFNQTGPSRILIPTTPTTNHDHKAYDQQIAKERQQLDQERKEYEDRKN
jgi:hypothetical protein